MDNFKFGRENKNYQYYWIFDDGRINIPFQGNGYGHYGGTSGSSGIVYAPPVKQLSGIKKYHFKGKYPKPR